jgi:predicted CXXCH cytochrome family protein
MISRCLSTLLAILFASLSLVPFASAQDKFKLKPGAKGKICLTCHQDFREKMKRPFIHTPVKSGNCSDCHDPHAARHGKLLSAEPAKICVGCHEDIAPPGSHSTHKVASSGNCIQCHDPHAANYKFNLTTSGNGLCFGCHKDIAEAVRSNKYKHILATKDCLTCHDSHSSSKASFLLKDDVPGICIKCHDPKRSIFANQHMNYPVEKSRCTSCHAPHGSNKAGILLENAHSPVVRKMCNQCHQDPGQPASLKLKREGIALCRGCHSDSVGEILGKNRMHWPLADKTACLNCHSPHASKQASLLAGPMKNVCGGCHADTIERQTKAKSKHKPVEEGDCTQCHSPHAANNMLLFDNVSTLGICGKCHEWQKHSSHPIGEKVADPRNRNISLDCLSCHRSHGTDQKHFTHSDPKMDLCVTCHQKYKR